MKLILLGAPGSGKGTQGQELSEKLGVPVISTGNLLRSSIREGTEVGEKAKSFVDAGKLVPDDVIIELVRGRVKAPDCAGGYIFDGFPRTIPQAEALEDQGLSPDIALSIEVPDQDIETRMTGRRVCPDCGASYHLVSLKPAHEGLCDTCGTELIRRDDDAPETVKARLETYHNQSEPLKGFYERRGKLKCVVGTGSVDTIKLHIFEALGL